MLSLIDSKGMSLFPYLCEQHYDIKKVMKLISSECLNNFWKYLGKFCLGVSTTDKYFYKFMAPRCSVIYLCSRKFGFGLQQETMAIRFHNDEQYNNARTIKSFSCTMSKTE